MPHPTWLAYGFAVIMVVVSLYCVTRLLLAKRLRRSNHYDVNVSHVLMGLAMAGMLVPRWNFVSNGVWEVVFAFIALWFLALSVRFVARHGVSGIDDDHVHHISHYLIHMVMGCAMLYMYWLGTPMDGSNMSMHAASGSAGDPGLTLLLVAVLFGSAVWQLDTISKYSPAQAAMATVGATWGPTGGEHASGCRTEDGNTNGDAVEPFLAPRLEIGCHILMCITMGYMLILML
ncbi:MAG: DUF5134 domain-containing protein [Acidimicrobiales bacterium]